jgi:hypothetical protein
MPSQGLPPAFPRRLQGLDGDLAELDHARAVLQRERSFGEQAVVELYGLLAVEDTVICRPLAVIS